MTDKNYLVCGRVEDMPNFHNQVPGSTKSNCFVCNAPIWVAPSGQIIIKDGTITDVTCYQCFGDRPSNPDDEYLSAKGAKAELDSVGVTDGERAALERRFKLTEPIE